MFYSSQSKTPLLSIAPMIDWTYDHFRVFMRLLAPQALLYTEMITSAAILHQRDLNFLKFNTIESPLALQIGGSDPKALANCAQLAADLGYCEINLNLGCPSDRVQAGRFGACLMAEPERVVNGILAMKKAVKLPVTAKIRLGIDEQESFEFFHDFARRLIDAGTDKLIIHARKAWLKGLNPKQNRTIPPLHYDYVYRLKQLYPSVTMIINGNISTSLDVQDHLNKVDGVMLGRLACDNPYAIAKIHAKLYPQWPLLSRKTYLEQYWRYVQTLSNPRMSLVKKPILNLAHGLAGGRDLKKKIMDLNANDILAWQAVIEQLAVLEERSLNNGH